MTKEILKKYRLRWIFIGILFLSALYFAGTHLYMLKENPFASVCQLNGPSIVQRGVDKNLYIVDESLQRILKTDMSGKVSQTFHGGSKGEKAFDRCKGIAVDLQGNIYINNAVVSNNGMSLTRESILQYAADGSFVRELFRREYDPSAEHPLLNGWIINLQILNGEMYFVDSKSDGLALYKLQGATAEFVYKFPWNNARQLGVSCTITDEGNRLLVTTKRGEIVQLTKEQLPQVLYTGEAKIGSKNMSVPWQVAVHQGNLYFTDIGRREIRQLMPEGKTASVLDYPGKIANTPREASPIYKHLAISEDGELLSADTFSVFSKNLSTASFIKFDTAEYSYARMMQRVLVWLSAIFVACLVLWGIAALIRYLFSNSLSRVLRNGLLIFTVSFIVSLAIGSILIGYFNQTLNKQVLNNISSMTYMATGFVDGDAVEQIRGLEDYQGPAYKKIRLELDKFIEKSFENDNNLYYVIYKTDGKNVYQCIDYINSSGTMTTMDTAYPGSYYESVMSTGQQVQVDSFQDSTGIWAYAVGPIYNAKHEVVGIIEIGRNFYTLLQEQENFIYNTIIDIFTVTIIILLLFTELLYFLEAWKKRRQSQTTHQGKALIGLEIVRPLTFSLLLASFLPTAFAPIYVSALYEPFWGIPKGLVIAVPLSAEVCTSAIFAVVAGYVKNKLQLKNMLLLGAGQVIVGFLLCGISKELILFTIGKLVVGAGLGFVYVAISTLIAEQKDSQVISAGYSDYYASHFAAINVGCVIGGGLAMMLGYQLVYYIAAAVAGIGLLLTWLLTKGVFEIEARQEAVEATSCSWQIFLSNPKVFSLLFFVYVPYLITSYFLYYFFPLFAAEHGITENRIAQVFLLNGLFVVYLGPWITPYITRFFGFFGSTVLGSILCISALSLFAFNPTTLYAVVASALLGIADSFAYTAQTTYYTGLRASASFGLSKANGLKNTVENAGYMMAPFAFGAALIAGTVNGIAIIGATTAVLLMLFGLLGYEKKVNK